MMKATDTILENLLDAVLVVNREGAIIYANRAAGHLFSRSSSQLTGESFGYPITPYEVQEMEVFRAGSMLTVQMLASPISWEGQNASLLCLRDITSQKQAQEELIRQKRLLEKTNEENAQYASLASHDLKEPIRKILMFSDVLLEGKALAPPERSQVEKVRAAAKRMNALIKGIADLTRVNHIQPVFKPVAIAAVVQEVVADLEIQIEEKKAKVEWSALPVIDAIEGEMYQLFLNLISNSLKYSKKDTSPHIRIRESESNEEEVCIECSDNGIGFDNKMSKKLFQPFQRLHTVQYEGMGVGLTLCKKIMEIHHGEIKAEGIPGQGSTFTLRLPRHQMNDE